MTNTDAFNKKRKLITKSVTNYEVGKSKDFDPAYQRAVKKLEEMEMNKDKKNIYQRMTSIMADVSTVTKEKKKVNGQYQFVSHDAVTALLHGQCVKHGVFVEPSVVEMIKEGNRVTSKVQVAFVNVDEPEDRLVTYSYGEGIDSQDKGPGKAYSYAFKMALLKTFMLESGEPDNERSHEEYRPNVKVTTARKDMNTRKPQPATDAQKKAVYAICKKNNEPLPADLDEWMFEKASSWIRQMND